MEILKLDVSLQRFLRFNINLSFLPQNPSLLWWDKIKSQGFYYLTAVAFTYTPKTKYLEKSLCYGGAALNYWTHLQKTFI